MYLGAALEEKTFETRAGAHQGLDAILRDLITPGNVQLLQQRTTLTENRTKKRVSSGNLQKMKGAMTIRGNVKCITKLKSSHIIRISSVTCVGLKRKNESQPTSST